MATSYRGVNLLIYFTISIIIVILASNYIYPSKDINIGVPIVNAHCGSLSGSRKFSARKQRAIYSYTGIPYAHPPIGDLRFKRPKRLEPWDGVREFTQRSNECPQFFPTPIHSFFRGDEDCLNLNVYVPNLNEDGTDGLPNGKLPVMVWIHGGGYVLGEASDKIYGPGFLLDRDVILVSVYYRLGALGSLNLEDDTLAAGNQALWDQRLALQWVQENIEAFGGDRQLVTVSGESAGGWFVNSHLASPKGSEGLFSAAIVQSGPLVSTSNHLDDKRPMKEFHIEYAQSFGCKGKDSETLVKCLRKIKPHKLVHNQTMFEECKLMGVDPRPWKPTFDGHFSSEPFFEKDPIDVIKDGETLDVPVMVRDSFNCLKSIRKILL